MKKKWWVFFLILTCCLFVACTSHAGTTKEETKETLQVDAYTSWKTMTEHFHPEEFQTLSDAEKKFRENYLILRTLDVEKGANLEDDSWDTIIKTFRPALYRELTEEEHKNLVALSYEADPLGVVARGYSNGKTDEKPIPLSIEEIKEKFLRDPDFVKTLTEEQKAKIESGGYDGFQGIAIGFVEPWGK